jgi:hypothetical protein
MTEERRHSSLGENKDAPDGVTYITLSQAELREIIRETSEQTLTRTLKTYGFDTENPLDQQADNQYTRRARKGSEQVATWIKRTTVGLAVTGGLWMLWEGLKAALKVKGGG